MTAVLLLSGICIIAYAVFLFFILTHNHNDNKHLVVISAPTEADIIKERGLYSNEQWNYPDKQFEYICQYILNEDCTARQVVKFIHNYFPNSDNSERKLLLSYLRINKPELYNAISDLLFSDSTSYEPFQEKTIPLENPDYPDKKIQSGIPADFFFTSLEIAYSSQEAKEIHTILNNISEIYESLPSESRDIINKQSKIIRNRKNKKSPPDYDNTIKKAIQEGNLIGEEFMEHFRDLTK